MVICRDQVKVYTLDISLMVIVLMSQYFLV